MGGINKMDNSSIYLYSKSENIILHEIIFKNRKIVNEYKVDDILNKYVNGYLQGFILI